MKTMKAIKTRIGLDTDLTQKLTDRLNELLANYQMFYMNLRGYHWNIKGEKFFELHAKFEELYNDAQVKIDEIAERVLTLGYTPMHSYQQYMETATIEGAKNVADAREIVTNILDSFQALISIERDLLELSAEANDEGTNALMSDYIRETEKLVWMYSAYLGR
jgi:starvation-inducible DNA-binding protein